MGEHDARIRAILDEARNAVAGGGAAAVAAAAGGGSPALVATSAVMGAIPATLATIMNIGRGWKETDAKKWWHSLLYGDFSDETTPEEIAGIVDEHRDKPFVRETILRSLRSILDAPGECVVTPLAILAREYLREKKNPDVFFRGTCSVLSWCSADMFEQLRRIASAMRDSFADPAVTFVRLQSGLAGETSWTWSTRRSVPDMLRRAKALD